MNINLVEKLELAEGKRPLPVVVLIAAHQMVSHFIHYEKTSHQKFPQFKVIKYVQPNRKPKKA